MASRTLSTNAEELVTQNELRRSLYVQNTDSTDSIFLKWELPGLNTVNSTNFDIKLGPGASLVLNSGQDGTRQVTGRFTAVASANTPRVAIFETEDLRR